MEQLGALRCVDSALAARRPAAEGPTERRRPRRWTAAAARRRRRAQSLHREAAGDLVGLDARVDGRFVAEGTPSQRRRNNAGHQCYRMATK